MPALPQGPFRHLKRQRPLWGGDTKLSALSLGVFLMISKLKNDKNHNGELKGSLDLPLK